MKALVLISLVILSSTSFAASRVQCALKIADTVERVGYDDVGKTQLGSFEVIGSDEVATDFTQLGAIAQLQAGCNYGFIFEAADWTLRLKGSTDNFVAKTGAQAFAHNQPLCAELIKTNIVCEVQPN